MHGSLLTQDFLDQGIRETSAWQSVDGAQFAAFTAELQRIHANVAGDTQLNEAQTEAELIGPVLHALGWHLLPQQQTNARGRTTPVRRFHNNEAPLFLISLKAGGVGLNLTAADTVIHYDPWWNPAVEAQATDRAHRIGQDKPVFVYKLICTGTVEEKIQLM